MPAKVKTVNLGEAKLLTPEQQEILRLNQQLRIAGLRNTEQSKQLRFWMDEAERRQKGLDVALAIAAHQTPIKITPKSTSRTSESTGIIVLSDWHVEETVDPSTVNDLNEFSLEIADRRIQRLFQKLLLLTNIWRNHTKVDTLVMALLGDLITGYIHEELQENNALSPTEAILWVQRRLVGAIQMLLNEGGFQRILIPCCIGNHGRTTLKPRVATAYRNNYEWLMYHNLAMLFETMGEKRVQFKIENGYHNYISVYGRTVRFHHGDAFKYQEGIGGITIPVNKGILRWNKSRNAWLDIFGHWHQGKDDGAWICNGSLVGYNPYAIKIKAPYEPPSQTLVFVERDHGKTSTMQIWLDDNKAMP